MRSHSPSYFYPVSARLWARREGSEMEDIESPWSSQSSAGTETSRATSGKQRAVDTDGVPALTGEVREGFLGKGPQAASPLTCTIPEILLEGCQEPCLLAAPASQSPLLPDAVSAEPNASSATPHPHPALHPTLQDSCRSLPPSAGSAKRPTQNSFVRAS